jgi:multiple sugar transport system ATP-binding protein
VAEGDKVVYGVRPEYMGYAAGPADGAVRGEVRAVENLGVNVLVTVDAGEQSLRAVVPEADEPDLGDTAYLSPAAGRVLLYRADGDGELISA